jgi:hypothetical protein
VARGGDHHLGADLCGLVGVAGADRVARDHAHPLQLFDPALHRRAGEAEAPAEFGGGRTGILAQEADQRPVGVVGRRHDATLRRNAETLQRFHRFVPAIRRDPVRT